MMIPPLRQVVQICFESGVIESDLEISVPSENRRPRRIRRGLR